MSEMEYGAVAHPHQMCVDQQISAEAYRAWGVIDFLKRNRIAPEPEAIAEMMQCTKRSVQRWIGELHEARWLQWNKNAADPWRRFELRQSNSDEEIRLAQIRALFASGAASVEAIAAILESDRIVQSDRNVQNDRNVQSDRIVQTDDPTIIENDRGVQIDDPTITSYDTTIIHDFDTRQQEAQKRRFRLHGGGGDHDSLRKRSPSTPEAPTAAEILLRSFGVSKKKARQLRDLDPHAVEAAWNATIPAEGGAPEAERQKLIGRLLDRWEVAPPTLPQLAEDAPAPLWPVPTDPHAFARQVAPEDATDDEIAQLAEELSIDGDVNAAIDRLYTRRWQAAHLPMLQPERMLT